MAICQDCREPIPYGVGFGGSVCPKCRARRAADSRRRLAELRGTPYAAKKHTGAWRQEERGGK
jgi:hypothetical protein